MATIMGICRARGGYIKLSVREAQEGQEKTAEAGRGETKRTLTPMWAVEAVRGCTGAWMDKA